MSVSGKNELERFTDKFGYNKIWAALEERVGDFASDFDIDTTFTLHDMDMRFTRNLTVKGDRFEYDAVYEVYVSYYDEYRDERTKSQWFAIHCVAEVDDDLKSFEVFDLGLYSKRPLGGNTTENFVPVISKKQMDAHASAFLHEHCPKALLEPTVVPIRDIAKEMGLDLQFGYVLSEDFSYFGQISFSKMQTRVYNLETGQAQNLDVTRGTILIDPEVFWERSLGCENFTIAHEVVQNYSQTLNACCTVINIKPTAAKNRRGFCGTQRQME